MRVHVRDALQLLGEPQVITYTATVGTAGTYVSLAPPAGSLVPDAKFFDVTITAVNSTKNAGTFFKIVIANSSPSDSNAIMAVSGTVLFLPNVQISALWGTAATANDIICVHACPTK